MKKRLHFILFQFCSLAQLAVLKKWFKCEIRGLFLIFLTLCFSLLINGQEIIILDANTEEPLSLVSILSETPIIFESTNTEGVADITPFKEAQSISIMLLGYKTIITTYDEIDKLNFKIKLFPTNLNLDEIVVSATRWRQNSDNIPLEIISISSKDVALQNPQTAADLLGISGKVFIQKSQQGGGSPMMRGFSTNRLLYTIDGVRMNTAIFRSGNIQNVINLDPFSTENTEVLFGPGSVIYGSDAIGGVMSFQTLTPELSLTEKPIINGNALARYSSANNEKTGHFDVNVGWKKWAFVTSFSSWNFDDLKQGSHGPDDFIKDYHVQRIDSVDHVIEQGDPLKQMYSGYSQTNLMQKIRFKPNNKWDIQYGFHYSETSEYGRYDRQTRVRNGHPRYGEYNYGPQKWMMNNLQIKHNSGNKVYDEMNIRLAQQTFGESRISRNYNSPIQENRVEEVQAYSLNLDFIKPTGKKNTIYYGAEYVFNDVGSNGFDLNINTNEKLDAPSRYPQAIWNSIGAYINDEFRVNKKTSIQIGMRYNQFLIDAQFDTTLYPFPFKEAKVNNGALTGSIGAVYRPNSTWVLSTNFGTAFRSPNVDDIGKFFESGDGAVIVPNPDLKAEYAYSFDAGVAKVFNDFAKIEVNAYYTILENALGRRDYQFNGQDSIIYDGVMSKVQAIQNALISHVYGIQASIEFMLPAGFSFSSDFNYQKGVDELEDGCESPTRHAPPMFGATRLNYKYKKLNLQLYTMYQGEYSHEQLALSERGKEENYALDNNGNTYAPSWYTINIKAMYNLNKTLQVSAGLENITDQRYRTYTSGISAAGRNFMMSVRAKF